MAKKRKSKSHGCLFAIVRTLITIPFIPFILIFYLIRWVVRVSGKRKPIRTIDAMTGNEFEEFCAELLRHNGFSRVRVTKRSGDQGVDIVAEKDGSTYAVQCKRHGKNVGNKAVQEVYAGKAAYEKDFGIVMTNREFTDSARELAEKTGVLLWGREQIMRMN